MISLANVVYYLVLILNIAIPAFEAVAEGMELKRFNLSYAMLIWIQILSCLVQFDACRRFYVFINKNTASGTNNLAVSLHVGVYMLYLSGLIYFYFVNIRHIESVGQH
jgi:hypothetical protein